jgi:peptidyl-prolyl cis-trans isomerase A (cyclophilin A)
MRASSRKGLLVACAAAALAAACKGSSGLPDGLYARVSTGRGDIVISLDYEKAPLAVCNFAGLAEGKLDAAKGSPFYDGLVFHRVEPGFVIQGGDPKGDGSGGPGYSFLNEVSGGLRFDSEGIVGMANAGPHTNGSQFFITLAAASHLNGGYTAFGKVVSGMEAAKAIVKGDAMKKVEILRVGQAARAFKDDQAAWDAVLAAQVGAKRQADLAVVGARWPGLAADPSGLLVEIERQGTGPAPARGSTAVAAYKLMLPSGEVIDSSDFHGGKVEFKVGAGKLISGLDISLLAMRQGEKRLVVIPPELGYGPRGLPGSPIEPYMFLAFEAELLSIK